MTDRTLIVQPGEIVRTGYVAVHRIRLACRERMAAGDVTAAFQKLLQIAPRQSWPAPNGAWDPADGTTFLLRDGRHEYLAALMLGYEFLFVAWIALPNANCQLPIEEAPVAPAP